MTSATGLGAMIFLLITLTITPVRKLTGWQWLLKLRRVFGRFTFLYAAVHVMTYIVSDKVYSWTRFTEVFAQRPAMIYGIIGFVLMIPMILTSNTYMTKSLGSERWQLIHKAIYIVSIAALIHYFIATKNVTGAMISAFVLALLLGIRLFWYLQEKIPLYFKKRTLQPIDDII